MMKVVIGIVLLISFNYCCNGSQVIRPSATQKPKIPDLPSNNYGRVIEENNWEKRVDEPIVHGYHNNGHKTTAPGGPTHTYTRKVTKTTHTWETDGNINQKPFPTFSQGHSYSNPSPARPIENHPNPLTQSPRFGYGTCSPPSKIIPFNWYTDAYVNHEVETFYTPLAHAQNQNSFHKAITGQNLRIDQNSDNVCLTTEVNWKDLTAVVTTFGSNKEYFKCAFLHGRTKFALECSPVDNQGDSFRIYFTKSDDKSYLVAYHCWESGAVEWFTYSKNTSLPQYFKNDILQHVQSLGFNRFDYKEYNYEKCQQQQAPTFSQRHIKNNQSSLNHPNPITQSSRFGYKTCTPPSKIIPFNWYTDAYVNHEVETFYTPLAHAQNQNSFHKAITGQNLRIDQNSDNVCLTTEVNWKDLTAVVTTFGSNKEYFKCAFLHGRTKFALECSPVDNQGDSFRIYFTKSDDKSYLVAYHCWESGDVEWFTYSKNTILPQYLKNDILQHVQSLGFNRFDYKEYNYEKCQQQQAPTFSQGHIKNNQSPLQPSLNRPSPSTQSSQFGYKTCTPPSKIIPFNWYTDAYVNRKVETFYTPLAHAQTQNSFHRAITGQNLRIDQNSDNICLTTEINWKDLTAVVTTFGTNKENFKCAFLHGRTKFALECSPVNNQGDSFRIYFTKSDDKSYLVAYHCWESGDVEWFTYSTNPVLPEYLKNDILQHVQSLGFNRFDYKEYNYEGCHQPQIPTFIGNNPFQPSNQGNLFQQQPRPQFPTQTHFNQPHPPLPPRGPIFSQSTQFHQTVQEQFSRCTILPQRFTNDFYYDSPLSELKRKEEFYIPLAGKNGYSSIKQFVDGSGFNFLSSEFGPGSGFCPKYEFDWGNYDTRFLKSADYQGRMERLKCTIQNKNGKDIFTQECFTENHSPVFRSTVTLTDHKSYAVHHLCWNSGTETWLVVSGKSHIPRNIKTKILNHVQELGFNPQEFNEINYKLCPGEDIHSEEESSSEIDHQLEAHSSSASLFPQCTPPSNYLKRNTWESSSNNEGVEFFDVAMAHPKAAESYQNSLGKNNWNRFSNQQNCLRSRENYRTKITNFIGSDEGVSQDFTCTHALNKEWIVECISKKNPSLSYRNYAIKSDNLSWMLTYQCLNSVGTPGTWTLWVAPGTQIASNTKSSILKTVQSLGFNPNDYVEFGSEKCIYSNRSFLKRTCDCCTENNARYI